MRRYSKILVILVIMEILILPITDTALSSFHDNSEYKIKESVSYQVEINFRLNFRINFNFRLFSFEKPLASIELYDKKTGKIVKFIKELEDFFFVGHVYFDPKSLKSTFSGLIFIFRFRNLFDVAMNYANNHNGLLDEFADLSGILFGYSSKEVAQYCSEERLEKFNLIK